VKYFLFGSKNSNQTSLTNGFASAIRVETSFPMSIQLVNLEPSLALEVTTRDAYAVYTDLGTQKFLRLHSLTLGLKSIRASAFSFMSNTMTHYAASFLNIMFRLEMTGS
jgi:hypothetical protein